MEQRSRLVILREHLDKMLAVYVVISIVIGYILGINYSKWVMANSGLINELMMASIFIMIFPMMLMLNLSGLVKAFKSWKMLVIVLLMNFGWGPLMAVLLGNLFLSDPLLRLGVFLAWLVPCSSMSIGYVGLKRGNIEAATALVAITFIVGIPIIPLFAGWYGSVYHLSVSMSLLIITIVEIIIIPLIIGVALHQYMIKKMGVEKFKRISPLFPSITTIGMFLIVFLIFLGHAVLVSTHFTQVIGIFYTAMIYGTISLIFMTFLLKYLKFDYWDSMAMIFPSIGKNEATAIAIASTAFSPFVAIPPAIFPIFQIIFLVTYIKLRPRIAHFYGIKTRDVEFKEIHIQNITGGK